MEKEIKIKAGDKYIYGTLAKAKSKSKALIIFVHGFTGHRNEHIFFNGAKYFGDHGFDTFRFDLYSWPKQARHFEQTKISLHGKDITTVTKSFKKKYNKIYLVGHSFGGTSLLFTDTSLVDALVFWDASYVISSEKKIDFPYIKALDAHTVDWGMRYIVGKDFVKELIHFPDCGELISKIHVPVKFIVTKDNRKFEKRYFVNANSPKSLIVIPTADHNFNTHKDETKLFTETLEWIARF